MYGLPNDFNKFDEQKKEEFVRMGQLLREQYESITGVNPDDVQIWYIEKQEVYYLTSFYYFKGTKEKSPYLSFAITEMFKFNK